MTQDIDYIQYRFSPPTRFGTVYRQAIEQSKAIGLLLNTPVLELVPTHDRIDSIKVSQGHVHGRYPRGSRVRLHRGYREQPFAVFGRMLGTVAESSPIQRRSAATGWNIRFTCWRTS